MTSARRRAWLLYGVVAALAIAGIGLAVDASARRAQKPKAVTPPALTLRGTSPSPDAPTAASNAKPSAVAAKVVPPAKSPTAWPAAEVSAARLECDSLLKGLKLDFTFAPSVRNKNCGSPQPVEVRSFGGIAVQPPAIVNCRIAAKLAQWLASDVQPLARKELKSDVVAIKNEAGYDCRNRYGDPGQKLSEHATANALDIGAFTLADGTIRSVLGNWGPVLRDLIKSARDAQTPKPTTGFATKVTLADGPNQAAAALPSLAAMPAITAELAAKNHLGSSAIRQAMRAEADALGVALADPQSAGARFIHAVHASACLRFGTVLGPEANDAHREHFHLDLAPRPGSNYCE